jgi:hypothetical protein
MRRVDFAISSMEMPNLEIGQILPGDMLQSDAGLTVKVKELKINRFVVDILEGKPFMEEHRYEVKFNPQLARYEIHGKHLEKWKRKF